MPKEYDVKDVNLYITDVMKLPPLERVDLWRSLQNPITEGDVPPVMVRRFHRQQGAVQANILYRFGPIIEKVVREQAQKRSKRARKEGDM